ncbi:hypothetical protein H6F67_20580 [Microcoleus sp. FACHB-1515]|uniref:hypothetical protein n=1 Tax=Cyanophyceae TaxID=3028117 RepID=UPI0016895DB8|nr:hypothetical protein [Microcoleus sp. FACHB-1515]MBD2092249.1 hypothetical protein [Microcoleus sp. FACHB-1515]
MLQSSRQVPLSLALRLLRSPASFNEKVQLLSGQLPDELPIEIPLLDQAQPIASFQQGQNFVILLQIDQPVLHLQSAYFNRLRAIGWLQCYSKEEWIDFNLFTATDMPRDRLPARLTFCYRPLSLMLILETRSTRANITLVRLTLSANDPFNFDCYEEWERSFLNLLPLPQLIPPPESEVPPSAANLPSDRLIAHRGRRGGGSEKNWYSKSNLRTSLSGSALLAHYEAQLIQAGWTRQAGEALDRLLWSAWTLPDRSLQLLLSFLRDDELTDHYAASLRLLNLNSFDEMTLLDFDRAIAPVGSIPEAIIWQLSADDFTTATTKRLWINQLPPEFPSAIELPAETEIVGSLLEPEQEEGEGDRFSIFLIAPLTSDQFWQQLTRSLLRSGWQVLTHHTGCDLGFIATEKRWQSDTFISPTGEAECYVSLETVERHCFDLRLNWCPRFSDELNQELAARIADLPTIALDPPEPSEATSSEFDLPVPTLRPPEQTEVIQSGGYEDFSSSAYITTALSAAALAAHYQAEMQQAGWQSQASSQSKNCYFSLWSLTVQRRSCQATLSLIAHPDRSDRFTGFLTVASINPDLA